MEETETITKQLLKIRSGEFDIESIHSLSLRKLGLGDLGCVGECSGMERLDLSYNDLTRLHPLASLTNLVSLNISANRISCLEGLQTLDNLVSLNLAGNLIGSADALCCLSGLEKLTELRLKNPVQNMTNPVCLSNGYRSSVLRILPKLQVLDGEKLNGKGSEMFKICHELDEILKVRGDGGTKGACSDITPAPWLGQNYWAQREVDNSFDKSTLADAEDDLNSLLDQCKKLCVEADDRIENAIKECSTSTS